MVGFNDMPFAGRFQPPLTTIRIPHYEIGMAAAELMLENLLNGGTPPRDIRLEPSLVVRGSTGPPPGARYEPATVTLLLSSASAVDKPGGHGIRCTRLQQTFATSAEGQIPSRPRL